MFSIRKEIDVQIKINTHIMFSRMEMRGYQETNYKTTCVNRGIIIETVGCIFQHLFKTFPSVQESQVLPEHTDIQYSIFKTLTAFLCKRVCLYN